MFVFPYLSLSELVALIDEPNQAIVRQMLVDHRELFEAVPGSSHKHQAWPGGYIDHVTEVLNLAVVQFTILGQLRPLPFSLADALLVLFLHDLEKPWKYRLVGDQMEIVPELVSKEAQQAFRTARLQEYGLVLTEAQANALRYVEGESKDYSQTQRVMNELAALCHVCDVLSARLWFDHPQSSHDPWTGATRAR